VSDDGQVAAIAAALRRLPPPARTEWATELVELGLRFHPELATKKLIREGPKWMGNHAPTRIAPIEVEPDQVLDQLSRISPEVAAKVRSVKDDAVAREAVREEFGANLPPELKARMDQIVALKRAQC
jgi:hypothetical protein